MQVNIQILSYNTQQCLYDCPYFLPLFHKLVEAFQKRQSIYLQANSQQLDQMDLSVQNQLLHRQFLSKISFNAYHSLLAAIADAADTLVFYHYRPSQNIFTEIFQTASRPSGKKSCLSWSPNGLYLALGSAHLQIWKLDEYKLTPVKNYNDDFIDIKVIAWSPDSSSLAYGGLSQKNTVKVRSLQSGLRGELPFSLQVAAISYDPFGKYLLILVHSNILYVYNCTSLAKLQEIPLSPSAHPDKNISTVKQIRTMGWSPDFNYLVCPSLDDSKVSLAFALCRSANFKITYAFFGHASSISCASFSPILYEWNGQPCSILAMGDSHGAVSIWRISSKNVVTPLLLSNSDSSSNEVVQELEWSSTGDILFVNMMKRYINILSFNKNCFGKEISMEQKSAIIQSNFGVVSASQIHKKQLEIFSFGANQNLNGSEKKQQNSVQSSARPQFYGGSQPYKLGEKVQYVKINEQVTIKDKNNRKKIQPALLVRREQAQKKKEQIQQNINALLPVVASIPTQYKSLNLKLLTGQTQLGKIGNNRYLELKRIQNYTLLQVLQIRDGQFSALNERKFVGNLQFVKMVQKLIYVYNKGSLYVFDWELNLQELPITLGDIHKLTVNSFGDIYFLSTQGFLRGFNHIKRCCYTPAAVPIHSLLQQSASAQTQQRKGSEVPGLKTLQNFSVQNDHNLYVTISQNEVRYFFDRQTGCWISLQLNKGLLKAGHSLRVSDLEQKLADDFFRKLNGKIVAQQPKGPTAIQQYESNLIYYKKHNPNQELYRQNLLGLIRQLKIKGLSQKLRSILFKHFSDKSSPFYQSDESLRMRVRAIGGNVIEEFIQFQIM